VSHWRRAGLILYLGTGPRQARQALMSSSVNADDDSTLPLHRREMRCR
jgi:hypothetical protein